MGCRVKYLEGQNIAVQMFWKLYFRQLNHLHAIQGHPKLTYLCSYVDSFAFVSSTFKVPQSQNLQYICHFLALVVNHVRLDNTTTMCHYFV